MCVRSPILIRMYGVLMEHPKFLRPHFVTAYKSRKMAEKLKEKTETQIKNGIQQVEIMNGVSVGMEKAKVHVIEMDIPFAPGAGRYIL